MGTRGHESLGGARIFHCWGETWGTGQGDGKEGTALSFVELYGLQVGVFVYDLALENLTSFFFYIVSHANRVCN